MAEEKAEVIETIKRLVEVLKRNNINIAEAYLFGSYAQGRPSKFSDIDVALISDDLSGVRYLDIKRIGRMVRQLDYRIEAHTFTHSDKEESMFLDEIIRTGIRVA
jgi:predicted nucleotidyltransferase